MDQAIAFLSSHTLPSILVCGWIMDFLLGDPARLPHPVVYMGKWISHWEHRLNKGNHRKAKGAIFAIASIALAYCLFEALWLLPEWMDFIVPSSFLQSLSPSCQAVVTEGSYILFMAFFVLMTFFCLAGHTLRKEVRMVFEATDESLEKGRRQVARIVGRDTQQLSAQEVRTAALETLAENLSDGVIAPLFWFALLGVPGMLAYKMVNTLDSMIGYQNERYKDFGCWAAHIDDIANYIPARLTAIMMLFANALMRFGFFSLPRHLAFVWRNARNHASPNSGWPEAALAGILDCRFGGTHNYFGQAFYKPHIGTNPRSLTTKDMQISISVCFVAEVMSCCIAVLLFWL